MKTFNDINIGDEAQFTKTISESDVYLFAGISGDLNPFHINEVYCQKTKFGKRLVHGMLTASLVATVLGMNLPGQGTIIVEQKLKFTKPVYFGDTVTMKVHVKQKIEEKFILLTNVGLNQNNVIVLEGESLVIPPRRKL